MIILRMIDDIIWLILLKNKLNIESSIASADVPQRIVEYFTYPLSY